MSTIENADPAPSREIAAVDAFIAAHHNPIVAQKNAELESLRQENSRLREALEFYADPSNYHAIAFLTDPPCGGFADDFSPSSVYGRAMPGKLAREALNLPKE